MTHTTSQTLRLAVLALVALFTAPALAQDTTPAELRREIETLRAENDLLSAHNEQLAAQNEQLASQIASMRSEIEIITRARAEAERQIAYLKSQLATRPATETTTEPQTPAADPGAPVDRGLRAPVPEDHLASPASLYNAVVRAYEDRFPNPDLGTDDKDAAYRERVTRWTQDVNRTMRGQTKWRIMLSDIVQSPKSPRGATARMTVLDPATGLQIGESFMVDVPSRMALKLSAEPTQYYEFTLMVSPTPIVNPSRRTKGVFEWPPFVGPMVDFAFDMEWGGLRRLRTATDAATSESEQETPEPAVRP